MALNMTRPTRRSDSSAFQFKRRTPTALLSAKKGERIALRLPGDAGRELIVSTRVGEVIKVSLRTREPQLARLRCAAINAQLERLASDAPKGAQRLTHREVMALAGEWHRYAMTRWGDDPGPASVWEYLSDGFGSILDDDGEALETHLGSFADDLLTQRNLSIDRDTRGRLLIALRDTLHESYAVLAKRSKGDYSADSLGPKLPEWRAPEQRGILTISDLFAQWKAEAERLDKSKSTIDNFGRVIRQFIAFLGHDDAGRVTREDVVRYKDKRLIEDKRSPKTVRDADLVALKTVFGWGVVNRPNALKSNPAAGVTLKLPKKLKRVGYSDGAALKILKAALAYKQAAREAPKTAAAKRWCLWLCAFTGARVGEIAQLRRSDVREVDGVWTIRITPEAGRVKDREERDIPLHPQLIELGFIEYVRSIPSGYLFLSARDKTDCAGRLQSIVNRLGEFARSIVREDRVTALHGWRHRFITLARRHGMDLELRRKITGHAGDGVDEEDYGDVEGLYREICKLPHCPIKAAQ
ncbi:MAG: tyrosine-type recombinase/integrase [Hyphomicrobium sp.]|uniref:site-specific integrase n=1 Tax=Hyphomicrobium sp. TaxID=82 RepID=UPI0013244164|nr:site-specific integrase [Hyphomicrobium sp.]KAB2942547.1 MAG: tyrosine-type recombinase/integrase [Hyphomicrobium sp.]MBZ0208518.1 tyrosine-type recombinase/integrase [Hyphomicrobium sp.]